MLFILLISKDTCIETFSWNPRRTVGRRRSWESQACLCPSPLVFPLFLPQKGPPSAFTTSMLGGPCSRGLHPLLSPEASFSVGASPAYIREVGLAAVTRK